MKRREPIAVVITAMLAITVLCIVAMLLHINGKLLALGFGAICGLGGFKLKSILG